MGHLIERTVDEQGNVLKEEIIVEPSPWMTIQEAAAYLRKTDHTIHEYARQGLITKNRIGDFTTVLVPRAQVEALVKPIDGEIPGQLQLDLDPEPETEGPHGPFPSNRIPAKTGPSQGTGVHHAHTNAPPWAPEDDEPEHVTPE